MRSKILMSAVAAFAMVSAPACKKPAPPPEQPKTSETPAQSTGTPTAATPTPAPTVPPAAPQPSIAAKEVAEMIGQGADLPKDFESLTVVDAGQIKAALKNTAIWKEFQKSSGVAPVASPDATANPDATAKPDEDEGEPTGAETADAEPVAAEESMESMLEMFTSGKIVIGIGAGAGPQLANFMEVVNLINRATMKQSLEQLAEQAGLIELDDTGYSDPFTTLLKDRFDSVVGVVEKLELPVTYVSVEAKGHEAKLKKMLAEWDASISEDMPPFIQKAESEIGGGKFVTFTVKLQDVVSLEDMKEGMSEDYPVEKIEKLHAAIAKKQMAFGFGIRKESLVFFLAPTVDSLKFAPSLEESIATRSEFELLAEAKGKNPFFVGMNSESVAKGLESATDNSYLADVFKDVLVKVKAMGDLRDVIALVEKAGGSMRDLTKIQSSSACAVGWAENGVRFEVLGGADSPQLDGGQPLAFAGALGSEDTVLSLNSRANPVFTDKALDFLEDISEISYELGNRYASSDAGKEAGMNEQFELFREKMLPHVTSFWKAMRGKVSSGLGDESALVMDLGAPIPKFPGLPEPLTKGRVPRMALVYPVTDRAKIGDGWKEMEPAIKGLLSAIPVPEDQKLNLPDPSISEKESLGLKTYAYPITGFTNDDVVPSMSISDKFLFLSTSKNFSEMLAGKLAAAKADPAAPRGLVLDIKFTPVVKTVAEWFELVKNNAAAVFPDEDRREDFLSKEANIRKALDFVDDLESLKLSRYPQGAKWRTSIHLKMKAGN